MKGGNPPPFLVISITMQMCRLDAVRIAPWPTTRLGFLLARRSHVRTRVSLLEYTDPWAQLRRDSHFRVFGGIISPTMMARSDVLTYPCWSSEGLLSATQKNMFEKESSQVSSTTE